MNKTTKTSLLTEDTHKRLKAIQSFLDEEYGIEMTIIDILAYIVPPDTKQSAKIILDQILEKRERTISISIVESAKSENFAKIPV